ncbi:MAG: hypothetical protein GY757_11275, partial [bacterium]|nr:hypothetical protein [bacterium]
RLAIILAVIFWCGGIDTLADNLPNEYLFDSQTKTMKLCQKTKGKHDAYPRYNCKDRITGSFDEVNPGKRWIPGKPLSFREKLSGNITPCCGRFILGQSKKRFIYCMENDNKAVAFSPAGKWLELKDDQCRFTSESTEDVIKGKKKKVRSAPTDVTEEPLETPTNTE